MNQQEDVEKNESTQEKIKEAARRVFTRKGYAATRTRDIAEESGYNLALINYYFRSKEKLFDIIMLEQLQAFIYSVVGIVNDEQTSLMEKVEVLVAHYIDMLIKNPGLPLFILSEANADPMKLIARAGFDDLKPEQMYIAKQWAEMTAEGASLPPFNPLHLMMNIMSMTIFPFVAAPLMKNKTGITTEQFNALMEERKKLIPIWMKAILMSGNMPDSGHLK